MRRTLLLVAVALGVLRIPAAAQVVDDTPEAYLDRDALQARIDRMTAYAESPVYSVTLREEILREVARIRSRLADGDFRIGDRIFLAVDGEPTLSDTFVVDQGPLLTLPTVGDIPLGGVLRSELRSHVRTHLSRVLRDPIVQTRVLVRVVMMGSVGRPGFYVFPGEALLSDAIMLAGGPGANANIDDMHVERDGEQVIDREAMQGALAGGITLDQLNLRAGDRIVLSGEGRDIRSIETAVRTVSLILSLPFAILALGRIF